MCSLASRRALHGDLTMAVARDDEGVLQPATGKAVGMATMPDFGLQYRQAIPTAGAL